MDHDSLIRCADFRPRRLVEPDSWIGHAPFADWLMRTLRPERFVELGTHTGNSYFTFCEAREQALLPTRCYAVDTWQGDPHAGFYGEDVYRDVEQYNNCNYAAFSRLMRMTFDEAQGSFADGSIDLFHIDGLHTYEAVKHDFEYWLPKFSPSAVVLFHDTNVRIGDFGVWRYWAHLAKQYPLHLEFLHSNGLGVLQLGAGTGRLALDWLIPDSVEQRLVIDYFTARGGHVADQFQIIRLHSRSAKLEVDAQTRDASIRELAAQRDASIRELNTQHAARIRELTARFEAEARKRDARIKELAEERNASIRELNAQHADRISALTTKFEADAETSIRELNAQHEARLSKLTARFEADAQKRDARIRELAAQRDATIRELNAQHEREVSALTTKLKANVQKRDARIMELAAQRDASIRELNAQHAVRLSELTAKLDADAKKRDAMIRELAAQRDASIRELSEQHDTSIRQLNAQHAARLRELTAEIEARGAREADLTNQLAIREQQIGNLNREVNASHETIIKLGAELGHARVRVADLLSSTSWRLTAPVRFIKEWGRARKAPMTSPEPGPGPTTSEFDGEFYLQAYPDVRAAGLDPYHHYVKWGASGGRLPSLPVPRLFGALSDLDPNKPTVLIVSHEASRTGAPILSLNLADHLRHSHNVVGLVFADCGMLVELQRHADVMIGPFAEARNPIVTGLLLKRLFQTTRPTFAIVNSIEARSALPGLAALFVPSLCLIHEFSSYVRPRRGVSDAALWATEVVFSASIVRSSAEDVCDALRERHVPVLPQGRSLVPRGARSENDQAREAERVRALLRPASRGADAVVILGAGSVQLRKGVDLFIASAGRVKAMAPQTPFRFVWVGHGYDPVNDFAYSVYLRDQIRRAGLENVVGFVGELDEIELAYEASDILFLSSRLDPLPNVAIDAAHFSRPIVCFDQATGMAEHLLSAGLEQTCVAPYLDIEGAARRLFDLIDDGELRQDVGKQVGALANRVFSMDSYVASLISLADGAACLQEIEHEDCALIERADGLMLEFFARPGSLFPSIQDAIRHYVRSWATGVDPRKPTPGFHPGVYREVRGLSADHPDPLADFIREGRPEGPWLTHVISPETTAQGTRSAVPRRALHIHAFHPDLLPEIVDRLRGQDLSLDVLVSVPSEEAATQARRLLRPITRSHCDIRVVPNRGRDIGPFITEFGRLILDSYDLIGHVHTKKSPDMNDPRGAKQWADFLYENLLGGRYPMATRILDEFAADDRLGLVFPDDPYALGWTKNKLVADELAALLGLGKLPERHFQFPLGTMFWARASSLRPLLELDWDWDAYPEEPLPYDGTMLHAIERLIPSVSSHTGYGIATTHVPGMTR